MKQIKLVDPNKGIYEDHDERISILIAELKRLVEKQALTINFLERRIEQALGQQAGRTEVR